MNAVILVKKIRDRLFLMKGVDHSSVGYLKQSEGVAAKTFDIPISQPLMYNNAFRIIKNEDKNR